MIPLTIDLNASLQKLEEDINLEFLVVGPKIINQDTSCFCCVRWATSTSTHARNSFLSEMYSSTGYENEALLQPKKEIITEGKKSE